MANDFLMKRSLKKKIHFDYCNTLEWGTTFVIELVL